MTGGGIAGGGIPGGGGGGGAIRWGGDTGGGENGRGDAGDRGWNGGGDVGSAVEGRPPAGATWRAGGGAWGTRRAPGVPCRPASRWGGSSSGADQSRGGPYPYVMGLKATQPRSRNNVLVTPAPEHYFSADPSAPTRPTTVTFDVAGREFRLTAGGGVFSATRLDPGTAVLLRKAELPGPATRGALLDLGCGYGPIACVLATLAPSATVYAIDVNTRALELTRANAEALGVTVDAREPDALPAELAFDQIWSNPPIRIGKDELHALLLRWLPRLTPDGVAWLVVARHLGADSLVRWLAEQGYAVARHASQQGFRVLRVTGKSSDGVADAPQNP